MKRFVKFVVESLALLVVLPAYLLYRAGVLMLGNQKAFSGWSQAFALLPGLTGIYLRRAFYRLALPRCEEGACISFAVVISHPTAQIGKNAYIGPFCCLGDVTIEEDVLLGSHISVMNGSAQHGTERLDIPVREQPGVWPRVTIGRDSWVGDRAVIAADVGEHCVIGAGAVVTRAIPNYAIAVGVPARVVRYRTANPEGTPQEATP